VLDPVDETGEAESAKVIGHLAGNVGVCRKSAVKAHRLLLVIPTAAVRVGRAPARAVTQGRPTRGPGILRPSLVTDRCAMYSKAGLARTVAWPARSASGMCRLMARALP
jgi:hypothetical protein